MPFEGTKSTQIMETYKDQAKRVFNFIGTLSEENPAIAKGFGTIHGATGEEGALTVKQKELIALGIAITIRCEGCIACHVKDALEHGATKEEIVETIGVSILMGGGPSVVYGEKAYQALEEFSQELSVTTNGTT